MSAIIIYFLKIGRRENVMNERKLENDVLELPTSHKLKNWGLQADNKLIKIEFDLALD